MVEYASIEDWGCCKMYGDECVFEDVYNIISQSYENEV